jgi:hypothetical protein
MTNFLYLPSHIFTGGLELSRSELTAENAESESYFRNADF